MTAFYLVFGFGGKTMKRLRWLAFGLVLISAPTAFAQEDKGDEEKTQEVAPESPFELLKVEFKKIQDDFAPQRDAIIKEYESAKDDEARQAIAIKMGPLQSEVESKQAAVGKKVQELVDQTEPGDDALEMVKWLLMNVRDAEVQSYALDKIVASYLTNEKILGLLPLLGSGMPSSARHNAVEKISEVGANDEVKAHALIMLAEMANRSRDMAKMYADAGDEALKGLPEGMADYLKKSAEITDEQIEGMLLRAAENYADIKYSKSTIGEVVKKRLKALEMQKNLQVGKIVPEIEGPDIDGVSFKLSDYRGQVVMLDFWGHW
jgi:hypothetical protein